jgi:phospholipid/cholesterol/gamma-HCH transport system substrate-binding protein
VTHAIRKHLFDFLAVIGLFVIGVAVAAYILSQQDFRFPLIEDKPKKVAFEFENAQAVQPGQGQTVRVAGVEVGRIADVKVDDGVALVTAEILPKHEDLIREDATALLRPKTGLKDMFVEVSPGSGRVIEEGGRISVANTLPDIDPDEIYKALDEDTRPYLKLLVSGAGKGLDGHGDDLREVFRRFEPLHQDLARVMEATANRRDALKRLIHRYGLLMTHVGRRPAELRRLVTASRSVFDALAGVEQSISESVARLPGALRASEATLREVREFAPVLRSSLQSLREPIRKLDETNAAVTPFLRETTPILRNEIRPFVRAARPFTDDLRLAARDVSAATPDLTVTFEELNRFFNIGAFNPGGAEGLGGRSVAEQRARQEGYLYWLAWVSQNTNSLFSSADGQGPWRRVTICGVPAAVITALIGTVLTEIGADDPAAAEDLIGGTLGQVPLGGAEGSPVDQILSSQFGSCNFGNLLAPPGAGGLLDQLRGQLGNLSGPLRDRLGQLGVQVPPPPATPPTPAVPGVTAP